MSEVGIVNLALSKLGERPILAFADEGVAGDLARTTYAEYRDELLQKIAWNFNTTRASLTASVEKPVSKWLNAFPVPPDYIQLHDVVDARDEQYAVESLGGSTIIAADLASPINIVYLKRIEDTGRMSPLFRQALAAKLAMEWAEPLLASDAKALRMQSWFRDAFSDAAARDGQEDPPRIDDGESYSWIQERF